MILPTAGALHDATGNLAAADILHLKPPLGTPPHGSCPPPPQEDAAQHAFVHLSLRSSSPAHEAPSIALAQPWTFLFYIAALQSARTIDFQVCKLIYLVLTRKR
jgi:hypothetical protein